MRRKDTFVLLALVLAASGITYLLAQAESPRPKRQPPSADSEMAGGQMTGQSSMQQMMRTMMPGVVPPGIQPERLPDSGSEGAKLTAEYCAQCHNLPSPLMHAASEWPGVAERMFRRMAMCSQMSGKGMMGKMGGMGMNGTTGMMNMKAPSTREQDVMLAYLKKHSLMSIRPDAIPSPRTEGALLFVATCIQCHALPDPKQHTAQEWPQVVARMRQNMVTMGKSNPSEATTQAITRFLESAAPAKP